MTPTTPPLGGAAATVTCTRAFWSQRHARYAFVFTVRGTRQRFTVYAADPYGYEIGASYALALTASAPPPGPTPPHPLPESRTREEES